MQCLGPLGYCPNTPSSTDIFCSTGTTWVRSTISSLCPVSLNFPLKFFLGTLGIEPGAAGPRSKFANHCGLLPSPFNRDFVWKVLPSSGFKPITLTVLPYQACRSSFLKDSFFPTARQADGFGPGGAGAEGGGRDVRRRSRETPAQKFRTGVQSWKVPVLACLPFQLPE